MKVKVFDFENEEDLEKNVNEFIKDKEIIDIKYQVAFDIALEEQIYCFSCMIIYVNG